MVDFTIVKGVRGIWHKRSTVTRWIKRFEFALGRRQNSSSEMLQGRQPSGREGVTTTARPFSFKQRDLTRALRAAVAASLKVQRYEIDKAGMIIIVVAGGTAPPDYDLDRELTEFEVRHGQG